MEKEFKRRETDLRQAVKRLTDLDVDFQRSLALLKGGVLTEEEFAKANDATRVERSVLEHRHAELAGPVLDARDKAAMADSLPVQIGSFLEDFQVMDVHRQKAHLQTTLKAAHISRDGRIELEFRG